MSLVQGTSFSKSILPPLFSCHLSHLLTDFLPPPQPTPDHQIPFPGWAIIILIAFLAVSCGSLKQIARNCFHFHQGLCFIFSSFPIKPDIIHRHTETHCMLSTFFYGEGWGWVIVLILSRGLHHIYVNPCSV